MQLIHCWKVCLAKYNWADRSIQSLDNKNFYSQSWYIKKGAFKNIFFVFFRTAGNVPNVIIDKGGKSDSDSDDDGFLPKDPQMDELDNANEPVIYIGTIFFIKQYQHFPF